MNERTAGTSALSQVLRCSVCEARVALERDITGEREASAGTRIVEVRRIANVIAEEDFACCARCGHKHFALELVDDVETELVTMYQREEVFARSPLKVLTITELTSEFFLDFERRLKDPNAKFVPGQIREYIREYTFNDHNGGVQALKDIFRIGEVARESGTEVVQKNVAWVPFSNEPLGPRLVNELNNAHPELAGQLDKVYLKYDFEQVQEEVFGPTNDTYDFVFVSQLQRNHFLAWSGIRARPSEEILVSSWIASGGNVLFGQWGLPKNAEESGEAVDLEELANFESEHEANQQKVFEKLIKRGCFLAWWKQHESLPGYARERISDALLFPLFSKWQFRSDLHKGEFDMSRNMYYRSTRANEIHDKYLRSGRVVQALDEVGTGEDDDDKDSVMSTLVRKVSEGGRLLFASGLKFFKALEDRLSEAAQS